jgi:hypothetical protein
MERVKELGRSYLNAKARGQGSGQWSVVSGQKEKPVCDRWTLFAQTLISSGACGGLPGVLCVSRRRPWDRKDSALQESARSLLKLPDV